MAGNHRGSGAASIYASKKDDKKEKKEDKKSKKKESKAEETPEKPVRRTYHRGSAGMEAVAKMHKIKPTAPEISKNTGFHRGSTAKDVVAKAGETAAKAAKNTAKNTDKTGTKNANKNATKQAPKRKLNLGKGSDKIVDRSRKANTIYENGKEVWSYTPPKQTAPVKKPAKSAATPTTPAAKPPRTNVGKTGKTQAPKGKTVTGTTNPMFSSSANNTVSDNERINKLKGLMGSDGSKSIFSR